MTSHKSNDYKFTSIQYYLVESNYETDTQCLQSALVATLPVATLLRGYYKIKHKNKFNVQT